MAINDLQLPKWAPAPQVDFTPLGQIGDAIAANRRKQAIGEALAGATDQSGNIDVAKAGTSLAQLGLTDEAKPMLALAQQKAALAQSAAGQIETARHNKAIEGIQSQAETRQASQPFVVPFGAGVMTRSGQTLREPGLGETGTFDDATLTALAKQAQAGDASVFTNLGRGAQGAANVIAVRKKIAELNQEGGEGGAEQAMRNAEYQGVKAGQRTTAVKGANIEMAATEFSQVLPIVRDASNAVNRTNYPDLNKIIQAYEEKTGDPNIVKFGGGVNTLVNLYARAISPTGNPTVSDKDHARILLNKAWSTGQFDAATGMMEQEIAAALSSPEKVRAAQRERFLKGVGPQKSTEQPAAAASQAQAIQIPQVTNRNDANAAIAAARAAVANGADPKAVNDRLRQMGVPPLAGP